MAPKAAGGFFMLGGRTKVLNPETLEVCAVGETKCSQQVAPAATTRTPRRPQRPLLRRLRGGLSSRDFALLEEDGTIAARSWVGLHTGGEGFPEEVEEGSRERVDAIVVGVADAQWSRVYAR